MSRKNFSVRATTALAAVLLLASSCVGGDSGQQAEAPEVHIRGNRLVDGAGKTIQLRGVNVQGSEYACVEPFYNDDRRSFFDLPVDDQTIRAMESWKVNAVRVPLNEQCWLGINPVERSGEPDYAIRIRRGDQEASEALRDQYRQRITRFVERLGSKGLITILALNWSAPRDALAYRQWPMPDADLSRRFWRSVARSFERHSGVIFELFSEPYLPEEDSPWECLHDGCLLPNACADCLDASSAPGCDACPTRDDPSGTYRAAGMKSLLEAVRSTGSNHPVLVPGLNKSNDLRRWLEFAPDDRMDQVGASFHAYEALPCKDRDCWERVVGKVAKQVPVVATEFAPLFAGREEPCAEDASYDDRFMTWADSAGVSYLAWSWYRDTRTEPPGCSYGLLSEWDGSARTGHGRAIRDHLTGAEGSRE